MNRSNLRCFKPNAILPNLRAGPYRFSPATREGWGKFFADFVDSQILCAHVLWPLFARLCESFHLPFLSTHATLFLPGTLPLLSHAPLAHTLDHSPSVPTEALSPVGLSSRDAPFTGYQEKGGAGPHLALHASFRPFSTLWAFETHMR